MRNLLLAAGAVLALAAGPAHAVAITDPTGDFLPTFAGDPLLDTDLDVTAFSVVYDPVALAFNFNATLAGDINPARPGVYVIGANTGTGTIRPFAGIGAPNVIFNQAIVVSKTGGVTIGANNSLTAAISGASFSLAVPLALLPSTGFSPYNYGFNLWPRNGLGANNQISDFAPDNANIQPVPEPATWALMIMGFGLLGTALRRRHLWAIDPV
jgi:hypothetical protein